MIRRCGRAGNGAKGNRVNLSSWKNDMVQLNHYLSDPARAKENLFRVSDRRYHIFQEKYSRITFFRRRTAKGSGENAEDRIQ